MNSVKIIRVHFTGKDKLELSGHHVPNFLVRFAKAIGNQNTYFVSEAEDRIMINISQVTFVEETTVESEDGNE